MDKSVYITDLKDGQSFEESFVLVQARQASSRNGPFWDLRLQDRTGQIEGKIWYPQSMEYQDLLPESMVRVQAQVKTFREQLQLIIHRLRVLEGEEIDWSEFVPSSARPPEELLEELERLCRSELSYPPWRKLCSKVLRDTEIRERLLAAPAAKSIHHAYRGGLLEHTLSVARSCLALCAIYPELDREILLVAAVLHDLGKAWELEGALLPDYSDEGGLIGHITLGLQMLEPFLQKAKDLDAGLALHLRHLILSHHGEHEFGSPKRPKTREAFVLHFADNLDAKVNTVGKLLQAMDGEGSRWSGYQYSLQRKVFQAQATPEAKKGREDSKKDRSKQCLLPLKE
jgi:3'-5' exoribonuclease